MIEIYFKSVKDLEFHKISDFRKGSWIHVEEATMKDLRKIEDLTHLSMADLQDCLDKYENPRLEYKNHSLLLFVSHPAEIEAGLHTATLAIFLTENFFITITPNKNPFIDALIESQSSLATTQKSKLLFFILLKITQDFTAKIKAVRNTVVYQQRSLKNINSEVIISMTKNEDILNQYLSALSPLKNVFEALTTGRYLALYENDKDLIQDLLIALKQSEELCNVNVKSIKSLRDAYQIFFTNDVAKTVRFLTAITIIFTIPTIISSLYGMNIPLPFGTSPHVFWALMGVTLFSSMGLLYFFFKKRWL